METKNLIKIGTCSWKYESWQGLVYPQTGNFNYLQEYSKHYDTVEIDQWFWSLFKGNTVVLPKADVVREYAASVPPGFVFSIKVPKQHHIDSPVYKAERYLSRESILSIK